MSLEFVNIDERAYKYIRQFTIKSTEDALVELITNSVDAYNKIHESPKSQRLIEIEYHDTDILIVRDHAIGLSGQKMVNCFLQVGTYTNEEGSRGFFSRGAKDISAIGDITFEAIKDNLYSRCFLNSDAYGMIEVEDQAVTQEIRDRMKMPGNGLMVTIKILPNFINTDNNGPSELAKNLSLVATLRDIMNDKYNDIYFSQYLNGELLFKRKLEFDYPEAETLLDVEYTVPNYSEATARFVVNKTVYPIAQPTKENQMVFGFLIKDSTTVYEVNTIDDRFRWNPYISYLYGYVKCDYINHLLLDYDKNGSSTTNPVPVIDPSRLTGVNKQHPFIISLLSIPSVRLDQILRELNTSISQQSISLNEVDQLFDELAKYGLNIVETEDITVKFVPNYDSELAKAIEDDRLNYVTSEKSYLITGDFNTTFTTEDQYIRDQIIRIEPSENVTEFSFVADENGELVQIPNKTEGGETQDPVQILDLALAQDPNVRPYVYQLGSDGELYKLYIFERGRFESVTNPENDYINIKNKKFQISFINDIHIHRKYIIENNDGIHIKLNLNDPLIKKYLMTENVAVGTPDLSIANISSTKSLVFLKDLMIEILAEVILESDVVNNKIILDSNNLNNMKKLLVHRAELETKLEVPIEAIFEKYISANKAAKETALTSTIQTISDTVTSMVDWTTYSGALTLMRSQLENDLSSLIE